VAGRADSLAAGVAAAGAALQSGAGYDKLRQLRDASQSG
jgi:anthranilate phosphoribosyltransferase